LSGFLKNDWVEPDQLELWKKNRVEPAQLDFLKKVNLSSHNPIFVPKNSNDSKHLFVHAHTM